MVDDDTPKVHLSALAILDDKKPSMKVYYEQTARLYKKDLQDLLKSQKLPDIAPSRLYCSHCDPCYKLLASPEKVRNNLLLAKQIRFRPDISRIEFRCDFKPSFEFLNPLLKESKFSTQRLGIKLQKFPIICQELDH